METLWRTTEEILAGHENQKEVESRLEIEKMKLKQEKVKQEVESSTSDHSARDNGDDGFSTAARGKRTGGGDRRGNRSRDSKKNNDRGYENFSSQSSRGRADSSGFVQPKHIQRTAKEDDKEKEDKSLETSVNAFSLLDMDDM